jgi:hypothetical protein
MKMFDYIDNVQLSESMKARLIKTTEEVPVKPGLTWASKNLIAVGASIAAIMLFFGGVLLFLPNDDYGVNLVTPSKSNEPITTTAPEPAVTNSPGTFTSGEAIDPVTTCTLETHSDIRVFTEPPAGESTEPLETLTVIRIDESRAKQIALARYREVYHNANVEIKYVELTTRNRVQFYRIELGTPGCGSKNFGVEVNAYSGDIVRDYHIRVFDSRTPQTDKIKVISGGNEFGVIEHWHHGSFTPHGGPSMENPGTSASGRPIDPVQVDELLPVIPYSSDFSIEIVCKNTKITGYTIYNWDYDVVAERTESFYVPAYADPAYNEGITHEYIIAVWGEQTVEDETGFHWSAFQFWIKIK